jgi:ribonuclease E
MPKSMLIDASHPEETRVVVLDGQKVDEFDFESASKRPLKGNIYLAKVTRVEPSLQAAFVEYGGNRQGFLAFSEIHPDYYQIPVADRQALLAEQQAEARRRSDEEFEAVETGTAPATDEQLAAEDEAESQDRDAHSSDEADAGDESDRESHDRISEFRAEGEHAEVDTESEMERGSEEEPERSAFESEGSAFESDAASEDAPAGNEAMDAPTVDSGELETSQGGELVPVDVATQHVVESESPQPAQALRAPRPPQRWMRKRHYKIQEVIKRRQVMLVQVVKEERGNKGAALTTYLSLAGRYCVLMPNTPRGGGISRKITSATDRTRLKSAAAALELPEGMGLIIRTAGENRTKVEIKRDYEYLLRMWDTIRDLTLKSNAPACVYEEGDLIKRAIRDLYNKDVSEIVVEGDDGYRNAKEFMRMLMPSHAKNVKPYKDAVPLFQRHHIEAQLDAMFSPTVTLRSGGYIVINQTEALVSIDVNSGRATREHSIEETAHKTNLEAAEEIARQLRLRDLAGLIVIDFIDMEDQRNDRNVEKRLRDCVKNDRARVQIGKISQFGLLEMSRQRLRAGVIAGSTVPCPHCGGQGIVRSVESTALRVLRALDEEGQRRRSSAVAVRVANDVALYTLNQKRRELARMESDYGMIVTFEPNDEVLAGTFEIERTALPPVQAPVHPKPVVSVETGVATPTDSSEPIESEEEELEPDTEQATPQSGQPQQPQPGSSRKRRRRRRGRDHTRPPTMQEAIPAVEAPPDAPQEPARESATPATPQANGNGSSHGSQQGSTGSKRRRRRRRGPRDHVPGQAPAHMPGERIDDHAPRSSFAGAETRPEFERRPAEAPRERVEIPIVTPNAPSEPVWSFTHEPAASTREAAPAASVERPSPPPQAPPQPQAEHAPEPSFAAPAPAQSDAEPPAPSDQPQRKGWWQRPFRIRD